MGAIGVGGMNPFSKASVRFGGLVVIGAAHMSIRPAVALLALAALPWVALAQPAPLSHKLDAFAQGLYHPQGSKRLTVVGDSINATNVPNRMSAGYRDALNIPWNGWVVHADNGAIDMGYMNAQNLKGFDYSTVWDPGDTFGGGQFAISPVRTRETIYHKMPTNGMLVSDAMMPSSSTSRFPAGDFFTSRPVTARLITYQSLNTVREFMVRGFRGVTPVVEGLRYQDGWTPAKISWLDINLGSAVGAPRIQIYESTAGVTPINRWEPWRLIALGVRYRSDLADGVQMSFIAHGGWRTVDHASSFKFSDEALRQYYEAIGPPTHMIVWLGQNQTNEEANQLALGNSTAFKANLRAVIARHAAACIALSEPAPRVLLVSQFKTGYDQAMHELLAHAMYDVAREDELVSFFNLYQAAGGEDFDVATYTSDGIHPNYAGSLKLAIAMNDAMESSIRCIADIDDSGFVDTVDLDAFILLFEAGDLAADVDGTQFIDTEDFDTFMQAYEAGC
jgi:lysophospholipase L1-like esterase